MSYDRIKEYGTMRFVKALKDIERQNARTIKKDKVVLLDKDYAAKLVKGKKAGYCDSNGFLYQKKEIDDGN